MDRVKNIVLNTLLMFGACIFTLFILEIGMRLFFPLNRPRMIVKKSPPLNIEKKIKYGYPLFEGIFLSTEYTTQIKTNSENFRDIEHELNKPRGTLRIVITGDSFTFGLGVEANQTYPKILEKILNETSSHNPFRYEVFNMGIAGIGTLEELEIIKYGIKYKPDLILLGLFVENRWNVGNGNDLCDNLKSWTESRSKELIESEAISPLLRLKFKVIDYLNSFQRFLNKHSALYFLLMTRKGTTLRQRLIKFRENQNQDKINMGWNITKDVLRKINALAQQVRAQFVIIRLPFFYDVYSSEPDQVSMVLAEFSKEDNINICDLLKTLRENKNSGLYYPADGHWKPIAHELAAKEIYNYLVKNDFLK